MTMKESQLLASGAWIRKAVLDFYASAGKDDGLRLARLYLFEIGRVITDMNGAEVATGAALGVAYSIEAGLPLENPIPPMPETELHAVRAPTRGEEIGTAVGRAFNYIINDFTMGVGLGYLMRSLQS